MIEFHITAVQIVALLVGVVSPLLIDLVTKQVTSNRTKAVLLLAISAITGLGSELLHALQDNVTYDLGTGLMTAVTAFLIGLGAHLGVWKTLGISDAAERVGDKNAVRETPHD